MLAVLITLHFAPTITDPKKILCVGLNYKAHQEETGRGGEGVPTVFVRFAAAQMGHGEPMVRPRESASLDFEGEIAMIIGRGGRRIASSSGPVIVNPHDARSIGCNNSGFI